LILRYSKIFRIVEGIKSDNLGISFSFIFHFLIIIFIVGVPNFFEPKSIIIPTIIPIEIINVTEFTSITKKINKTQSLEVKKIALKEKKFNSSNNLKIKKIETKDNLKIENPKIEKKITQKKTFVIKEKKIILKELKKEKISVEKNEYESIPLKKLKPKLKPKLNFEDKKIIEPSIVVSVKPKIKPKLQFNIASMLKDLRNEKSTPKIDGEIEGGKKDVVTNSKKVTVEKMTQPSISEIDLVLQQLSMCFVVPAGTNIKKTMFVKIAAKIKPNRRVYESSIRIVETNIDKSNPIYGPITESAMRTLLNPKCIPLMLPENKYNAWKDLTLKFDYSIMRGN
tara:strand:+ start:265 stop:1281 length:1017 start_codon:yes stop_codon:yes gene_type:complete